jgi:D-arabinose 1-dehydrogenase-like Zn-dependent alcohol dehydrogenase
MGPALKRGTLSQMVLTSLSHLSKQWLTNTSTGQIGGHEGVGEIISHGPGVSTPPIGTNVGIKYAASACLNCGPYLYPHKLLTHHTLDRCLTGGETSCTFGKISGAYHPGTFQQYLISSAQYITPPDGVDLAAAGPLMCAGISLHIAEKSRCTAWGLGAHLRSRRQVRPFGYPVRKSARSTRLRSR